MWHLQDGKKLFYGVRVCVWGGGGRGVGGWDGEAE